MATDVYYNFQCFGYEVWNNWNGCLKFEVVQKTTAELITELGLRFIIVNHIILRSRL